MDEITFLLYICYNVKIKSQFIMNIKKIGFLPSMNVVQARVSQNITNHIFVYFQTHGEYGKGSNWHESMVVSIL